jgi:hypothetical protein
MGMTNLWPEKAGTGTAATTSATAAPSMEPSPVGRPKSNLGQYLIKANPDSVSGFEMMNDVPDMVMRVQQHLRAFELPPALQPKYLRKPAVMDTNRAKNISRGWRKPRGMT